MTHYETLGVAPGADAAEIREAYRRLAREHHPDHRSNATGSVSSMAAINEAYRVLRDPGRRAVYDAGERRQGSAAGPAAATPRSPDPTTPSFVAPRLPARYPWKLVVGMAVVGTSVVVAGAILRGPASEPAPDNLLGPGSCVDLESNGDAREVSCSTPNHLVVVELVTFDGACRAGTEAHRDRQGRGIACLTPAPITVTT